MGNDPVAPFDGRDREPFWIDLAIFAPIPYFPLPCSGPKDLPHRAKELFIATRLEYARGPANYFLGRIAGGFGKCAVHPQDHTIASVIINLSCASKALAAIRRSASACLRLVMS